MIALIAVSAINLLYYRRLEERDVSRCIVRHHERLLSYLPIVYSDARSHPLLVGNGLYRYLVAVLYRRVANDRCAAAFCRCAHHAHLICLFGNLFRSFRLLLCRRTVYNDLALVKTGLLDEAFQVLRCEALRAEEPRYLSVVPDQSEVVLSVYIYVLGYDVSVLAGLAEAPYIVARPCLAHLFQHHMSSAVYHHRSRVYGVQSEWLERFRLPQLVGVNVVSAALVCGVVVGHVEFVVYGEDMLPCLVLAAHKGVSVVERSAAMRCCQHVALQVVVGGVSVAVVRVYIILSVAHIAYHVRLVQFLLSRELGHGLYRLSALVDERSCVITAAVALERPNVVFAEVAHAVPLRLYHHLALLVHESPFVVFRLEGAHATSQRACDVVAVAEVQVCRRSHLLALGVDEEAAQLSVSVYHLCHGCKSVDERRLRLPCRVEVSHRAVLVENRVVFLSDTVLLCRLRQQRSVVKLHVDAAVGSERLPFRSEQILSVYRPYRQLSVVYKAEHALADIVKRIGVDVGNHLVAGVVCEVWHGKHTFAMRLVLVVLYALHGMFGFFYEVLRALRQRNDWHRSKRYGRHRGKP